MECTSPKPAILLLGCRVLFSFIGLSLVVTLIVLIKMSTISVNTFPLSAFATTSGLL